MNLLYVHKRRKEFLSPPLVENDEDDADIVARVSLADGLEGQVLAAALRVPMLLHVAPHKGNNIFRSKDVEEAVAGEEKELVVVGNRRNLYVRLCDDERLVPVLDLFGVIHC